MRTASRRGAPQPSTSIPKATRPHRTAARRITPTRRRSLAGEIATNALATRLKGMRRGGAELGGAVT